MSAAGRWWDKKDRKGKIAISFPFLSLSIPFYPFLSLSIPFYPSFIPGASAGARAGRPATPATPCTMLTVVNSAAAQAVLDEVGALKHVRGDRFKVSA